MSINSPIRHKSKKRRAVFRFIGWVSALCLGMAVLAFTFGLLLNKFRLSAEQPSNARLLPNRTAGTNYGAGATAAPANPAGETAWQLILVNQVNTNWELRFCLEEYINTLYIPTEIPNNLA